MTHIPKRIKRKSEKADKGRRSASHRKWIRGFGCSVPGCATYPVECAHVQASSEVPEEERGGTGYKPHDKWTYPLCRDHHEEAHRTGHNVMDEKYGLDRAEIARTLYKISPHRHAWEARQ